MGGEETEEEDVRQDVCAGEAVQRLQWVGECDKAGQRGVPDDGSEVARECHEAAGDDEAFGGTVEVAEEECMAVIGLPSGEEHGEGRDEGGEGASARCAETHGGCFEEAAECAIERVDSVAIKCECWEVRLTIGITNSKSSPSPLDVPVRLACLPSTLSMVEYLDIVQL